MLFVKIIEKAEIHDQFKPTVLNDDRTTGRVVEENLTILRMSLMTDQSFLKLGHV